MSFTVEWNSTDITHKVVSYKRDHSLCDGTGTLDIEFSEFISFDTWDEIVIKENSTKKGTYYVSRITKHGKGSMSLYCENGAKRIGDYFVHSFYTPNWVSTAKYWIQKFLNEAGATYEFNVAGNGAVIAAETTALGRDTVFNIITPLLQQSGWYIIFDENNKAIIGKLDKDISNPTVFNKKQILSAKLRKNDKMSRNRVVVWGGVDRLSGAWVSGLAESNEPWQTSPYDDRSVVISNASIPNYPTAYSIAWQVHNEFRTLTKVKEVEIAGFHNVTEGDVIYIDTDAYCGTGMITSLMTSASPSGEITSLVLDERCPRLFAYFVYDGYVYIGTWGDGVYRKPLETTSWSSYNSGLGNMYVKDLYIQNGVFVAVTDDGYAYYSTEAYGYWRKLSHGIFEDHEENEHEEDEVEAVSCTINNDNEIIVGYNSIEYELSWVLHFHPLSGIRRKEQVIADDIDYDVLIYDLDNTGERTIIGVAGGIPADYTKGGFPSSHVIAEGTLDFPPSPTGQSQFSQQTDRWAYFNNADYFLDYPESIHKEYAPMSLAGTPPPCYGSILSFGKWNFYGSITPFLGNYVGKIRREDAHDQVPGLSISFTPWDGTLSHQRASQAYAVYDENTVIATAGSTVYKVDFTGGGSFSSVGTLTDPGPFCDSSDFGPFILAMWSWEDCVTIFYNYSTISHYDVTAQNCSRYYISTYKDGAFTNHGEVGAYPYGSMCIDGDIAAYHSVNMYGQVSLYHVVLSLYSAKMDDYWYEDPPPNMVSKRFASYKIDIRSGAVSSLGTFEPSNEDVYYNRKTVDYGFQVFPSSHTMKFNDSSGNYKYILGINGLSESSGQHSFSYDYDDVIYWKGGLGTLNTTTGAITTVDGSFPLSNTTYYPIDYYSHTASDTDGAIVYYCNSLTSGVVIENGTDIVQIQATDWTTQTVNYNLELVGNRIITGAEIYSVSGYLFPSDAPTRMSGVTGSGGFVLRDNYLTGTLIPSGYAGFTTILSDIAGSPHIEISKEVPTLVYTESSGISPSYMWTSYTNEVDDFFEIAPAYIVIVNDARVYTHYDESVPESGGFRVGVVCPSGLLKINTDLTEGFSPIFPTTGISGGTMDKLETTNYDQPPFFFVKTGSGGGQKFWQKNPTDSTFSQQATNLPTSNITIIRVDDIM